MGAHYVFSICYIIRFSHPLPVSPSVPTIYLLGPEIRGGGLFYVVWKHPGEKDLVDRKRKSAFVCFVLRDRGRGGVVIGVIIGTIGEELVCPTLVHLAPRSVSSLYLTSLL